MSKFLPRWRLVSEGGVEGLIDAVKTQQLLAIGLEQLALDQLLA